MSRLIRQYVSNKTGNCSSVHVVDTIDVTPKTGHFDLIEQKMLIEQIVSRITFHLWCAATTSTVVIALIMILIALSSGSDVPDYPIP